MPCKIIPTLVQPADVYVHSHRSPILNVCRLSDQYRFLVMTDRFENIINEFPDVELLCTTIFKKFKKIDQLSIFGDQ